MGDHSLAERTVRKAAKPTRTPARSRPRPTRAAARVDSAAPGANGGAPRIYYLHTPMAGPLAGWPRHFERIAALGFDTVLASPLGAPGRDGHVFRTADPDRVHPLLQFQGPLLEAVQSASQQARAVGLVFGVDTPLAGLAADSPLVAAHPNWFTTSAPADELPDPRRRRPRLATFHWDDAVLDWHVKRLSALAQAGAVRLRLLDLAQIDGGMAEALCGGVRSAAPDAELLAWTPGLDWQRLGVARGAHRTFSSFAWWDLEADWWREEAELLARIAPAIAPAEAPFGPRAANRAASVAALLEQTSRLSAAAAACGQGWLMPMGFEYGARRPLDPMRDGPETLAELEQRCPAPMDQAVRAANSLSRRVGSAPTRLLLAAKNGGLAVQRAEHIAVLPGADGVATATVLQRARTAAAQVTDEAGAEPPPAIVRTTLLRLAPAAPIRCSASPLPPAVKAPRLAFEQIAPTLDGGRFAVKRVVGDTVVVEADIIVDGHDRLGAALLWRPADEREWRQRPMKLRVNDRWRGDFPLQRIGRHVFTLAAWRDDFATLCDHLAKKRAAAVPYDVELQEGVIALRDAARTAGEPAAAALLALARRIDALPPAEAAVLLLDAEAARLMHAAQVRPFLTRCEQEFPVDADRPLAAFAAWYEVFPRSLSDDDRRHGTFEDVIRHLPRIAGMGFDVLYFPPIHPIGRAHRKGRNNSLQARADDPGSPYAIGGDDGGHEAIHRELGDFAGFRRLLDAAQAHGLEIALDFAIQCSSDHPWLKEHPGWFAHRPDGTIRHAENPPKKYEDIVNIEFYTPGEAEATWRALRDVVAFWLEQGVRIFRVDNPHTKPLPFWEWLIADIRSRDPGAIFLSEAFTRPKVMYRLAKLGFTQSYTYFTWRNTRAELTEYLEELNQPPVRDLFRPHFFVNTPDINPLFLQTSGRPGFLVRAALATTLSGLWGMYNGFELCEGAALPGREEYLDSEKYQLRAWDWDRPGNIRAEITRLNGIRRRNPALHTHLGLTVLRTDNDQVLCFQKATAERDNVVLVAINLDPHSAHSAGFEAPLWQFGRADNAACDVEDLWTGARTVWRGKHQQVWLDLERPFAIWRIW